MSDHTKAQIGRIFHQSKYPVGALIAISMFFFALFSPTNTTGNQVAAAQTDEDKTLLQISVDEEYISQIADEALADDARFSKPEIDLHEPANADVTANIQPISSFTIRPTATLAFSVVNDRLEINVTSIRVRSLAFPTRLVEPQIEEITAQIEDQVNVVVAATEDATGLVLKDVHTTDQKLIFDFGEDTTPQLNGH